MYENIMGIGSHLGRVMSAGEGINSKIDLKFRLLELSRSYEMDFDTLMGKFKEEYDQLPLTSDDSKRGMVEGIIPQFSDMLSSLQGGSSKTE